MGCCGNKMEWVVSCVFLSSSSNPIKLFDDVITELDDDVICSAGGGEPESEEEFACCIMGSYDKSSLPYI